MSVLGGFLSTWSSARESFGDGPPQGGAQFDASATLSPLQGTLTDAAPGETWTGAAALAYDTANTRQLTTVTTLAGLDQRLGAYLDQSADVVTTGRANLDAVRQWVLAAVSSVPPGADAATLPIVAKGLQQLQEIITTSNGQLSSIGDLLDQLRGEYDDAGGKGGTEVPKSPGDEKPETEEERKAEEDAERQRKLDDILENYQTGEDEMTTWEPGWPLNEFTDPKEVTQREAEMLDDLGVFEMKDFRDIKDLAENKDSNPFPAEDSIGNHHDAFRHAYWNALMTQRFGEEWTADFATAHEGKPMNAPADEAMDLYNNEIGRQIAVDNPDASPEELATLVEQAVRDGDTVVIRPDGQGLAFSDQIQPGATTGDTSAAPPGQGGPIPQPTPGADTDWNPYDPGQPSYS